MEESELEEGEALAYNGGVENSSIDPEIAFSYIGEKLQHVLGHFQKDFEGGVSAENLGPKYGGYGSFLPTYQRSPSASHNTETHEHDTRREPKETLIEDQRQSSSADALRKTLPEGNLMKGNVHLPSTRIGEANFKCGVTEKSSNPTLKVRIKVGSENLLKQKNELYSGLGLVISPSSSMEGSPVNGERASENILNAPEGSPTSILQIMTSSIAGRLLSPLSEDLLYLTEKRKHKGKTVEINTQSSEVKLKEKPLNGSKIEKKAEINSETTDKKLLDCESAEKLNESSGFDKKVEESKSGSHVNGFRACTKDDGLGFVVKSLVTVQSDANVSKGRNQPIISRKGGSGSEEGLQSAFQISSPMQQRKSEGIQNIGPQGSCVQKDKIMIDSSSNNNGGSMSHGNDLQENIERPPDLVRKDIFGNGEDDIRSIPNDYEMRKVPQPAGKRSMHEYPSTSKERCNGNTAEKPQSWRKRSMAASQEAVGNGHNPEAPGESVTTDNDGWISCSKCKKWRRLPPGKNRKSLPDKWRCRMLYWLPGMNHCNIPQEETTNALRALNCPSKSEFTSWDTVQESQNNVAIHGTTSEKTKLRAGLSENSTDLNGSPHSSPTKSILLSFAKNKKRDGGNHSPLVACGTQNMQQPNDDSEKQSNGKRKESLAGCSDAGIKKKPMIQPEFDVDGSRTCKRIKRDVHSEDENWTQNGVDSLKPGSMHSNDISNYKPGSDMNMYTKSEDPRGDSMHPRKSYKDSDWKRKGDLNHDSHPIFGQNIQNSVDVMAGNLESGQRKKKKARVSMSEEKDVSGIKSRAGSDGKDRIYLKHHNHQYKSNSPSEDCFKNGRGLSQQSIAANSSSSKVSGSQKNKVGVSEVKGSPVDSVSSSPLKLHNADKVISATEILAGKDDFQDSYSLNAFSSRRSSGDGLGGIEQGIVKKDAKIVINDNTADHNSNRLHEAKQLSGEKNSSERCRSEVKTISDRIDRTASNKSKKYEKGLSLYSKDKAVTPGADLDKEEIKAYDSSHDYESLYKEKAKSRRNKFNDRSDNGRIEKLICKKDTVDGPLSETSKGCSQMPSRDRDDQEVKRSQDKNHNLLKAQDTEKLDKKYYAEANGNGEVPSLPPSNKVQAEISVQPISSFEKENNVKDLVPKVTENGGASKASKPSKRTGNQTGQPIRDFSNHAANNALKEAKDLKHIADRQKNSGSTERNGFYFQAALKFLHAASLLESGGSEESKQNDLMNSMRIYSSTAKLCEFCAHEFEKSKDMAAAALAYKCMEVAYLRVVFSLHSIASKDRNELQNAIRITQPGESPFSSASDVDNLIQGTGDKSSATKVTGSPQVSANPVITAQNRSSIMRLLDYAQDVTFAMDASRKSRSAYTAATSKLGETDIFSLKKALDFNFQDVDGLLRLVRISMEAIHR